MPGKWNIDYNSPYARYPEFDKFRPELKSALVDEMRNKLISEKITGQTEAVVRDAIPKALIAKCGLAFKSELVIDDPHPMWDAKSNLVTHRVRMFLTDDPPREWSFIPYEIIKELWEKHNETKPQESLEAQSANWQA